MSLLARVPTLAPPQLLPSAWSAAVDVLDALAPWLARHPADLHKAFELLVPSATAAAAAALGSSPPAPAAATAPLWSVFRAAHRVVATLSNVVLTASTVHDVPRRLDYALAPPLFVPGDAPGTAAVHPAILCDASAVTAMGSWCRGAALMACADTEAATCTMLALLTAVTAPTAADAASPDALCGALQLLKHCVDGCVPVRLHDVGIAEDRRRCASAVVPALVAVWPAVDSRCRMWASRSARVRREYAAAVCAVLGEFRHHAAAAAPAVVPLLCQTTVASFTDSAADGDDSDAEDGPTADAFAGLDMALAELHSTDAAVCVSGALAHVVAAYTFDWTAPPTTPRQAAAIVAPWGASSLRHLFHASRAAVDASAVVSRAPVSLDVPRGCLPEPVLAYLRRSTDGARRVLGDAARLGSDGGTVTLPTLALHAAAAVLASGGVGADRRCVIAAADTVADMYQTPTPTPLIAAALVATAPAVVTGALLGLGRITFAAASMSRPAGAVLFAMLRAPCPPAAVAAARAVQQLVPALCPVVATASAAHVDKAAHAASRAPLPAGPAAELGRVVVAAATQPGAQLRHFQRMLSSAGLVLRGDMAMDEFLAAGGGSAPATFSSRLDGRFTHVDV